MKVKILIHPDEIQKQRKKAGITQTKLAKAANVSQAHISKLEKHRVNPGAETLNWITIVFVEEKIMPREVDGK